MNFSGVSRRTFVGKVARLPLRLVPRNMRVLILQGPMLGKWWIARSSNHGCWLGSYEYDKQRAFQRVIEPGSIVFDIGANVGFYTLLASVLVGPRGKVFAFEPLPRNIRFLVKHMRLNRTTNVTIIRAALSDFSGIIGFDEGKNNLEGRIKADGRLKVRVFCLDDLISQGKIPIPDYLKIDVEGAEMLVLTGAKAMISTAHPVIFLATHSADIHRQCCDFLGSLGYDLQAVEDGRLADDSDELIATFVPKATKDLARREVEISAK